MQYAALLSLCFGAEPTLSATEWASLMALAVRQRCLVLAWWRAGDVIRRLAPADIVAEWRIAALSADLLAREQLAWTARIVEECAGLGIDACVMRGPALSERLYGDASVRWCTDIDLFVAAGDRQRAHRLVQDAGFRHMRGTIPNETTYTRPAQDVPAHVLVEVHSTLLDDGPLARVPLVAERAVTRTSGGLAFPTLADHVLAVYMAAEYMTDARRVLLRDLDFLSLWPTLGAPTREAAFDLARKHRLDPFLRGAMQRADLVAAARSGDARAIDALLAAPTRHSVARALSLSRSPALSLAIAAEWARPAETVGHPARLAALWWQRAGKTVSRLATTVPWRRSAEAPGAPMHEGVRAGTIAAMADSMSARRLALAPEQLSLLLHDVRNLRTPMWMRVRGSSMQPAIPYGALVRIAPLLGPPRVGDVVLAQLSPRVLVVHRVKSVGGRVVLRGDNTGHDDPAIDPDRLLAKVTHVELGARVVPVEDRPRFSLRQLGRRYRRLLLPVRRFAGAR